MSLRLTNPHELRERLTSLYVAQFRRTYGVEMARDLVAKKVIADLSYVDSVRRAGDLHESTSKAPAHVPPVDKRILATPTDDRPAPQPSGEQPIDYRPDVLFRNPMAIGERFALAMGRIARICEGVGVAKTFGVASTTAEMPALARRFADHYAWFMMRERPAPTRGVDRNPYRGMTDRDAARAFMRAVEDIADASSGKLGPWRVPK